MNVDKTLNDLFTKGHSNSVYVNDMNDIVCHLYESGFSCLEIMKWMDETPLINKENKPDIAMKYHKIRREFRCEKMLMFFLLLYSKKFCVKNT